MSTILDVVVLVLSISCGVLGVFLLTHRGVRMMKGGLVYTIAMGLAGIGLVLTVSSVASFVPDLPWYLPPTFQIVVLVLLYYIAYTAWTYASKVEAGE